MSTFTDQGNAVDSFIRDTQPTTNKGTDTQIQIGEDNGSVEIERTLIKWDLSSIPTNAIVDSAVLSIWTIGSGSDFADNTRTMKAYRILRNWVVSEVTWNIYSSGNNWGTAGCSNTTTDREATDIGSVSVDANFANGTELQLSLTASAVQQWISGASNNYGVLLQMDTESNDMHIFESTQSGTGSGVKPKIVINYHLPGEGNTGYTYFM